MNPRLRKQVQGVRNVMEDAANDKPLPPRFQVVQSKTSPAMVITDTETGNKVEAPMFAYGAIRVALQGLFGTNGETKPAEKPAIKLPRLSAKELEEAELEEYTTSGRFIMYTDVHVTTTRKLSHEEMTDIVEAMKCTGKGDADEEIEVEIDSVDFCPN